LLARAGDTVADTDALPPGERDRILSILEEAAGQLAEGLPIELAAPALGRGGSGEERRLLEHLPSVAAWVSEMPPAARKRSGALCRTLFGAMRRDLDRFGAGEGGLIALADEAELEEYLYGNAGCVGEYWARELAARDERFNGVAVHHLTTAGIHLGKALQRVNVLRDLADDLRRGRCYLPRTEIAACRLEPGDLLAGPDPATIQPLIDAQIAAARSDLEAGTAFFRLLPRTWVRDRAAAALPAILAEATLARMQAEPERLLDPGARIKVPRRTVYALLLRLLLLPPGNRALARMIRGHGPRRLRRHAEPAPTEP
jgi:farnesyl-diphosphate farnesyltransferase